MLFPVGAGPGDIRTGRFYLFTGRFVVTAEPSGVATAFTSRGTSRDVSAVLT